MAPEPTEAWVTVFEVLGTAFGLGFMGWMRSYLKGRAEEGDRGHDIPARAVGAAFLDRSAADTLVGISGDIRKIREVVEDVADHADKDRTIAEARRVAREEIERVERARHGKGED